MKNFYATIITSVLIITVSVIFAVIGLLLFKASPIDSPQALLAVYAFILAVLHQPLFYNQYWAVHKYLTRINSD